MSSNPKSRVRVYIPNASECALAAKPSEFDRRLRTAIHDSAECELVDTAEAAALILVNQLWKTRNWRDIEALANCPFLTAFSEKVVTISHDDIATVFLPGLYTSLTPRNRWQDWSTPCAYKRLYGGPRRPSPEAGAGIRRWLFSFRGCNFSHPVRITLSSLYASEAPMHRFSIVNVPFGSHSDDDLRVYTAEMRESHFALAPRGWSPSTYRVFEAMQNGRCPVIISDEWQPIDGVDWDACSIRVAEEDVRELPDILRSRLPDADRLGRNAREAWASHFADGARETRMLRDALRLHRNCVHARDIESLERFWNSRDFVQAHGWALPQRLRRRLSSLSTRVSRDLQFAWMPDRDSQSAVSADA